MILEKPFYMGESLNGRPGLNIEAEMKLVEGRLKELCAYEATEREKTIAMKELGMIRYVRVCDLIQIILISIIIKTKKKKNLVPSI